jgi:hypothetical protein
MGPPFRRMSQAVSNETWRPSASWLATCAWRSTSSPWTSASRSSSCGSLPPSWRRSSASRSSSCGSLPPSWRRSSALRSSSCGSLPPSWRRSSASRSNASPSTSGLWSSELPAYAPTSSWPQSASRSISSSPWEPSVTPFPSPSGRHALQASSFPFAHPTPHAVALVAPERVVQALDTNGTVRADPLRLSRRASLLGEEDLGVVFAATGSFLPWDVVMHRSLPLESHACDSGPSEPRLTRGIFE